MIIRSAAADEVIAVEMVGNVQGFSKITRFSTEKQDIKGQISSEAFWYNAPYYLATLLNWFAIVVVILVPLLIFLIYKQYGREKEFAVPAYMSTLLSTALNPW